MASSAVRTYAGSSPGSGSDPPRGSFVTGVAAAAPAVGTAVGMLIVVDGRTARDEILTALAGRRVDVVVHGAKRRNLKSSSS